MRIKHLLPALFLAVTVTGCGVQDIARQAADATACSALNSTINTIANNYQTGIIDSTLVTTLDSLVGEPARALLSSGLAEDLKSLTNALQATNSAEATKTELKRVTDSISKRCAEVTSGQ
jgi:glycerol-3-phosphate O-acyltransferase